MSYAEGLSRLFVPAVRAQRNFWTKSDVHTHLKIVAAPRILPRACTKPMKNELHPKYTTLTVNLSDGSTIETRSTLDAEEYTSDVDSTNHPFYTGRRQFVDTAGRVEKFNRRYGLNNDNDDEDDSDDA